LWSKARFIIEVFNLKLKYLFFSLSINLTFIYLISYSNESIKNTKKASIKLFIENKYSLKNETTNNKSSFKKTKLNEIKEDTKEKNILNKSLVENITGLSDIFITLPAIEYPKESISKAEQGLVKINVIVNTDKKISVKLIKSSGHLRLDRSALKVAKNLKVKDSVANSTLPAEFILDFDFIL